MVSYIIFNAKYTTKVKSGCNTSHKTKSLIIIQDGLFSSNIEEGA